MSSPFASFRKHQTYWMAGVVLLSILAFIVAPAIDSMMGYLRTSSHPGNDVVVRWSDGKVTSDTLNYVRMQHARTMRFLHVLGKKVVDAGGMPKVPGFRWDPSSKQILDLGLPKLDNNRSLCQALIMADHGKQLGVEVDQSVTEDFIKRFCDRKITSKQFDEILRDSAGRELTVSQLHRQLALELTARVMYRIGLAGVEYEGVPLTTPGDLWENYLRLNQSARIEAYPILTSDFVKQVKETPTEAEIRQLYDAGSVNYPSPNSPQPGFRRRYQANVEYVSGSWNKLLEVEKAKITEEALRAEYDRLVGLGGLQVPADTPKSDGGSPAPGTDGQPPAPPADGAKPEASETPQDKEADKPSEGEPPAPESTTPAADSNSEAEKPGGTEEGKPDDNSPEADPAQSQSRAGRPDSQIRLVAFQQEQSEKKDDLPPAVENPASPDALSAPDAATPKPENAQSDTPESQPASANAGADAAATGTAQPAAGSPAASASPATAPMRTQTFEEAKDALARSLAMNVVREQLEGKLAKIQSAMNAYASKKTMERINAENGRKPTGEPAKIDLKKLAEAEGLSYGSTGMIDGFRLAALPVGGSRIPGSELTLANAIMNPNVDLFRPVRSTYVNLENLSEPDFQEFISWKIDEEAAYVPALNDIRDEVIEAWKTQRARTLAKDEAQKLADKLKAAGDEPWKSVLDPQQQTLVVNPPPFTWMSASRDMFAPAQISFVQGLDTVGPEFMQRVFSTPTGQLTVAPDEGLSIYYVVRLVELTPTVDQLRQNFEVSRGRARLLAMPQRDRLFSDWYENIERTLNVQWLASDESLME